MDSETLLAEKQQKNQGEALDEHDLFPWQRKGIKEQEKSSRTLYKGVTVILTLLHCNNTTANCQCVSVLGKGTKDMSSAIIPNRLC